MAILEITNSSAAAGRLAHRMLATRFAMWAARELDDDKLVDMIDSIARSNSLQTMAQNVHKTSTNPTVTMILETHELAQTDPELAELAKRTGHSHAGVHVRDGTVTEFLCEVEDVASMTESSGLQRLTENESTRGDN